MHVRVLIGPIRVAADVPPAPVSPDPAGVISSEARSDEEDVSVVEAVEFVVEEGVLGVPVAVHRGHGLTVTAPVAVHSAHTAVTAPVAVHRAHTAVTAHTAVHRAHTAVTAPLGHSGRASAQCGNCR